MRVLGDLVRLNARRYPDKKALFIDDRYLTFEDFNNSVNRLAHGLLSMGVQRGDRVAIWESNSIEFLVINYAILKCGAISVTINFRYKLDEVLYVCNDARPKILFYGDELIPIVRQAESKLDHVIKVAISDKASDSEKSVKELMSGQPTSEPGIEVNPDDPAYIMYTGGTTGFPKGVVNSHGAILAFSVGLVYEGDLKHDDLMMVSMPMFHNGALNYQIVPTLLVGAASVIMNGTFEANVVLSAVEKYGVTATLWVPSMLARLVNDPSSKKYKCPSLKKIWYGASTISPTILNGARELLKADFYQLYGLTETGCVSILKPQDHIDKFHYTGREMFTAEIRIVDDQGRDVSLGGIGEIITRQKPQGMDYYYNMEKATEETIRNGWIYTGDLARVEADGYFSIVDRTKDMIISGGENIYPKEIENIIITHPAIAEVAVFGIPDEMWGEAVCAAIVTKEGENLSEEALIEFCSFRVAGYKKPKKVLFLDDLPKNAAGKITKNTLREPFWVSKSRRV